MQIDVNGKPHIGDALRTHIERDHAAIIDPITALPSVLRIASTRMRVADGGASERTS